MLHLLIVTSNLDCNVNASIVQLTYYNYNDMSGNEM